VNLHSSGTDAIITILKSKNIKAVIVAQDMCPEVIFKLIQSDFNVILAPVYSISSVAAYGETYLKETLENPLLNVCILFSHPYGIYSENKLILLMDMLRDADLIISDCCLCNPIAIIEKFSLPETIPVVFSFGYSKVIDLGGGGLSLTDNKIKTDMPSITKNISRHGHEYKLKASFSNQNIDHFLKNDIYKALAELSANLNNKKSNYRERLKGIFFNDRYIDSEWRFILLTDMRLKEAEKIRNKMKQHNVFLGLNYPLQKIFYSKVELDLYTMNKNGWPINIFTDFRVSEDYMKGVPVLKELLTK